MKTLSQSVLKDFMSYLYGDMCGLQFYHKNIVKDITFDPSEAMLQGRFFEYIATGYHNERDGIPEPQRTKKGELTAEYKRAESQASKFIQYMKDMDFEIVRTGHKFSVPLKGSNTKLTGILDVEAVRNGVEYVIDLKWSGLVGNKWEEYGWHPDSFEHKFLHHVQPMHYSYVTGKKFMYYIAGSQPSEPVLIMDVEFPQPDTDEMWEIRLHNVLKKIDMEINTGGFIPRPSMEKCASCPLLETCDKAQRVPTIHKMYVSPTYDKALDQ